MRVHIYFIRNTPSFTMENDDDFVPATSTFIDILAS